MKTKWYTRLLAFLAVFFAAILVFPMYMLSAIMFPLEYIFFGRNYPYFAELFERMPRIVREKSRKSKFYASVGDLTGWELID